MALANVVCEAFVKGMPTRKVEDLVETMEAKGVSRSEVPRKSSSLDHYVDEFFTGQFEMAHPYLWQDALYIKVREHSGAVSKAVLVVASGSERGEREVRGSQ